MEFPINEARHRVHILFPIENTFADGDIQVEYGLGPSMAAAIEEGATNEYHSDHSQKGSKNYRVRIRYQTYVNERCALLWQGKKLFIRQTQNPGMKNVLLDLQCQEAL